MIDGPLRNIYRSWQLGRIFCLSNGLLTGILGQPYRTFGMNIGSTIERDINNPWEF